MEYASQNPASMESKKKKKKCSLQTKEKAKGGRLLKVTETSYKGCFILNVLNMIALEKKLVFSLVLSFNGGKNLELG